MTNRLRKGGSLSGRERNCAFLNLDGKRFATVSALSGFDFADDSRSLALVDWDMDGNMDVWVSNRTAPRVRFLRNKLPSNGNWIQFGLESEEFLDPVGSRVELTLKDGRKLLRTLRAGEGFLGQSSRYLHFGVGEAGIQSLRVRWPDGKWQELEPVKPGQRYVIRRGQSVLAKMAQPTSEGLVAGPLEDNIGSTSPWVRVPLAIPMPPLILSRPEGQREAVPSAKGKFTLINFWDPICEECSEELLEWKANQSRFPKNLQVETLLANSEISMADGLKFIDDHNLPFDWGRLDLSSTRLLAKLLQNLFQTRDNFSAPASFLVNPKGELVSFSIGKVSVDEVVAELASLPGEADTGTRLNWVYGEQGRWIDPVERIDLLFVPRNLMENGQLDLAASFVRRAWHHLSRHRDIDRLLVWIGDSYVKAGNAAEGLKFYLNALTNGTKDPIVMNNVAWQLATHPDDKIRNGALAVKWAEKAVEVTEGKQATYYDTLAAAYAEQGRFPEALATLDKGARIAIQAGERALLKDFVKSRDLYRKGLPNRGE